MTNQDSCKIMSGHVANVIVSLGFSRYGHQEKSDKMTFYFAITNQGQSTEDSWRTFPVIIEVTDLMLNIKTVFAFRNQTFSFDNEVLRNKVLEYINIANLNLLVGAFNINSNKNQLVFESKAVYSLLDQGQWYDMVKQLLTINISTYKSYIYGVVRIIDSFQRNQPIDIKNLIQLCENRGRPRRPEPAQESSSDTSSENENENENVSGNKATNYSSSSECTSESQDKAEEQVLSPEEFTKENVIISRIKNHQQLSQYLYLEGLQIVEEDYKIYYENDDYRSFLSVMVTQEHNTDLLETAKLICDLLVDAGFYLHKFPASQLIVLSQDADPSYTVKLKASQLHKVLNLSVNEYSCYDIVRAHTMSFLVQVNLYKLSRTYEWTEDEFISPKSFEIPARQNVIGHGGFGYVYKNEIFGQEVALKFPKKDKENQDKSLRRLKKEYWLLNNLRHPNIINTFGYTKYQGQYAILLEYCNGDSINNHLQRQSQSLTDLQKLVIAHKIASAIEYMHHKKICHFDVKPQNILLTNHLEPKLCDFGLSEQIEIKAKVIPKLCDFGLNEVVVNRPKIKPGFTLMYSAPEQLIGKQPSYQADVWSFGMMLYYLFIQRSPFDDLQNKRHKLNKELIYKAVAEDNKRPEISSCFEAGHPKLVSLMREIWQTDPTQRPPMSYVRRTLGEMIEDMKSQNSVQFL